MPQLTYQEAYNRVAAVWRDASLVERQRFTEMLLAEFGPGRRGLAAMKPSRVASVLDSVANRFLTEDQLWDVSDRQAARHPEVPPQPHELTLLEDPDLGPVTWPRLWRWRAEPDNSARLGGFLRFYQLADEPDSPIRRQLFPEEIDTLVPGLDDVTILNSLFQTELEARAFVSGWGTPYRRLSDLVSDYDVAPFDVDPAYDPGTYVTTTRHGWVACCWVPDARNLIVYCDERLPSGTRVLAVVGPDGPIDLHPGDGQDRA